MIEVFESQSYMMLQDVLRRGLLLIGSLLIASVCHSQKAVFSFAEAKRLMLRESDALKAADASVQIARKEASKATSWWWPQVQADGMYAHLSERVEVRQPLSLFTDPAKAYVQSILPSEQLITSLLDEVGRYTLTLPLLPQDLFSVGLTAEWVAFSGGKRIFADRMARRVVDVAQANSSQVQSAELVLLVERYYGLALAEQNAAVCHDRYEGLRRHYEHAVKLESVGMIDKAARLFAQVAMEEALREYHRAQSEVETGQMALKRLLGMANQELLIIPSSSLFMSSNLPPEELFQAALLGSNPTLSALHLEEQLAGEKLRIDQSAYLPEVVLFGKQTLYAHGLPSNLFPRTIVGVGFTWNLFDGLERERQACQTRLVRQSITWSREEAESEYAVAVSELYATLLRTESDVHVLNTTIALNEELLRMRHASFAEGLATSAEVVDAENALSAVRLARLAAYYAYDVALASLLALCGMADSFEDYNR